MRSLLCREAVKETSTPFLPWEFRIPHPFLSADALTGVVSQCTLTPGGTYCPSDLLAAACSSSILMCNLLFTSKKVNVPLSLHACLSPRVF